jgi:hypothetical protein
MRTIVVACEVLRNEVELVLPPGTDVIYVEQGLHNNPPTMREPIQKAVAEAAARGADRVVLAYGLCGEGILGVQAVGVPLIVPRLHDCIPLLLGSVCEWKRQSEKEVGTYFVSRGWLEFGTTPQEVLELYKSRMDPQLAEWAFREQYKHYRRILWIDTGADPEGVHRKEALDNAELMGLAFEETTGELALLRRIVEGGSEEDVIVLQPGEAVQVEAFLGARS